MSFYLSGYQRNQQSLSYVDDEHFEITAQVRISDMFFSWVCGFGKRAKIVYPEHIIDEFAAFLDGIKSVY